MSLILLAVDIPIKFFVFGGRSPIPAEPRA